MAPAHAVVDDTTGGIAAAVTGTVARGNSNVSDCTTGGEDAPAGSPLAGFAGTTATVTGLTISGTFIDNELNGDGDSSDVAETAANVTVIAPAGVTACVVYDPSQHKVPLFGTINFGGFSGCSATQCVTGAVDSGVFTVAGAVANAELDLEFDICTIATGQTSCAPSDAVGSADIGSIDAHATLAVVPCTQVPTPPGPCPPPIGTTDFVSGPVNTSATSYPDTP
jgi:hypothetical protein